jgi:O-antigen/teichoic acid export membrane protein
MRLIAVNSFISSFGQVAKLISSFIINKFIAITFGTSGIGIYSFFNNFNTLITQGLLLGSNQTFVSIIAKNKRIENKTQISNSFLNSILIISLFASLIIFISSNNLSQFFFNNTNFSDGFKIISISIFFGCVSNVFLAILNGFNLVKKISYSSVLSSSSSLLVSIFIVYFFDEKYLVLVILTITLIPFFILGYFALKIFKFSFISLLISLKYLGSILKMSYGILIGVFVSSISDLIIQAILLNELGLDYIGLFNSSFMLSTVIIGFITGSMAVGFLPQISKLKNDKEIIKLVYDQIIFGFIVLTPIVVILILFSNFFFSLIFSKSFIAASDIFFWHLLGSIFKVIAFPLSFYLVSKLYNKKYLISQIIHRTLYPIFIFAIIKIDFDLIGVDYFTSYTIYTIYLIIVFKNEFNFSVFIKHEMIKILKYSLIILSAFILSTFNFDHNINIIILSILLSIYYFIIRKNINLIFKQKNKL